jgi:hypothetical protein
MKVFDCQLISSIIANLSCGNWKMYLTTVAAFPLYTNRKEEPYISEVAI